ncbi:MAG: glutamate-5-semialdehyde dehydrogenase [Saprospiraceae bacterium]|jgi:glutamate-5-semialdehyde dehydrogenase
MKVLNTDQKNNVLCEMIDILGKRREEIIAVNKQDLDSFDPTDRAMYDRLVIDDYKIDGMIAAVTEVKGQEDPIGKVRFEHLHENGMKILNKTAPFGTIMIIYESRPDVTIEAAVVAFKSSNKILLKGGKEAIRSNEMLVECWHQALATQGLAKDWITLIKTNRIETQEFLSNPPVPVDLIVPRGGEGLIAFVKKHAKCAVLISGRGNNFLYADKSCDWEQTKRIILSSKIQKISACNALDKVLIHEELPDLSDRIMELYQVFKDAGVEVVIHESLKGYLPDVQIMESEAVWGEEFLAMKICIGLESNISSSIERINTYSGGHSATIMSENIKDVEEFMEQVDGAAVYHNASTRFTDGGQLGVGAELAISTDKLHHRGPLGLDQLVTNKWYIYGQGQIRQ